MTRVLLMSFVSFALSFNWVGCEGSSNNSTTISNVSNTKAEIPGYQGEMNGNVENDRKLILGEGVNTQDAIRNTSFERIYLRFQHTGTGDSRTELPVEAMNEINSYLKSRLSFCHFSEQGSQSVDEKVKRDKVLLKAANKTINQLVLIEINTPEGKRNISQIEAGRLVEFVGINANELCRSLKKE